MLAVLPAKDQEAYKALKEDEKKTVQKKVKDAYSGDMPKVRLIHL